MPFQTQYPEFRARCYIGYFRRWHKTENCVDQGRGRRFWVIVGRILVLEKRNKRRGMVKDTVLEYDLMS